MFVVVVKRCTILSLLLLTSCATTGLPTRTATEPFDEAKFETQFYYPPPTPAPERVEDAATGQELDARYFLAFPDFDRAYSPGARRRAKRLAQALVQDANGLSHEAFTLRVAEIVALADNAHTAVSEDVWRKNTPRIPLRTFPFADGLHVLWAGPGFEHLLGARVDTIEGHRIADIRQGLRRYEGGPARRRDVRMTAMLESPALLQAAGWADDRATLDLAGARIDGAPFSETIPAEERGPASWVSTTARTLFPRKHGDRMTSLLERGADLPVYLQEPTKVLSLKPLQGGGLYFGMNTNADPDEGPLAEFLDEVLSRVGAERPAFFVLDLRLNGGGDLTKSQAFARALPQMMQGRPIYVVISPWTFSAGITTAATVESVGGDQVRLVGEPVGDRLDFFAEGGAFDLPNSSITVFYTSGRHVYDGPCTDRTACYWLMERYRVRVKNLAPDIPAPMTFAAYREQLDPALEAIYRELGIQPLSGE